MWGAGGGGPACVEKGCGAGRTGAFVRRAKRLACQEWDSNPRLQGRLRPERSALDRSAILTRCISAVLKFHFNVYLNDSLFFFFFPFSEDVENFQLKKATTSLRTAPDADPEWKRGVKRRVAGAAGSVF